MTLLLMIICHTLPPAPTQHHMELTPACRVQWQALPCPVLVIPTPLCHWFLPSPQTQTQLVSSPRLQTEAILAICRGSVDTDNASRGYRGRVSPCQGRLSCYVTIIEYTHQ